MPPVHYAQKNNITCYKSLHYYMQLLAKTFKGLEDVLAQELTELGANDIQKERRAVSFTGDKAMLYRANLCLRTASRVLVPIATFRAKDADAVYEQAKSIDWSEYMTAKTTFAIDATVYSETFRHSKYVTYRVKDAIADYWMARENQRPSVKVTDPDLSLNVHIANETVTISLDSSGESLHKRGYRAANTEAPINEALAAGMILMTGWRGESDFYDPMCGSGTLLIEAALIAQNIAPGIFRKGFAFEKWRDFDADLFAAIYNDDSRERAFEHHIYGSDAGYYAVQTALKNVQSANQQRFISVRQIRLEEIKQPFGVQSSSSEGDPKALPIVMMNPPYGERLAQDKNVLQLYQAIGTTLKHQFAGATAWIISSNEEALKCVGLKPSQKVHLLNGELDCLFCRYDLFVGTHKDFKTLHPSKERRDERKDFSRKNSQRERGDSREKRAFGGRKTKGFENHPDSSNRRKPRDKDGRRFTH